MIRNAIYYFTSDVCSIIYINFISLRLIIEEEDTSAVQRFYILGRI
jgi:hypothetical protein